MCDLKDKSCKENNKKTKKYGNIWMQEKPAWFCKSSRKQSQRSDESSTEVQLTSAFTTKPQAFIFMLFFPFLFIYILVFPLIDGS